MFIPIVIALLNTDPRASSDRALRVQQAAACFVSKADMICGGNNITLGVDAAWNFLNQPVCFGCIVVLGKKKGENRVVPIVRSVPLCAPGW